MSIMSKLGVRAVFSMFVISIIVFVVTIGVTVYTYTNRILEPTNRSLEQYIRQEDKQGCDIQSIQVINGKNSSIQFVSTCYPNGPFGQQIKAAEQTAH